MWSAPVSSSRSDRIFAGVFAHSRGAGETGDEAWLRATLDVERVLAKVTGAELPDEALRGSWSRHAAMRRRPQPAAADPKRISH